jgi:hAT family C-terminal dimerisation region
LYFLASIRKRAKKKLTKEGEYLVEFFRGINRVMDVNLHNFYSQHGPATPKLIKVTANILCLKFVSTTPEITFSTGGFVHSNYRQCLLPSRSEGIILLTCRYKVEKAKLVNPAIPVKGVVDNEVIEAGGGHSTRATFCFISS